MRPLQAECAARVVEIVPFVLRHLRAHIRSQRERQFTIPQFRGLTYLYLNGQATLSELAASQGVSLPTMSKLVGSLVKGKLVAREGREEDRRKLRLQLTREGVRAHDAALESTREYVASKLVRLPDDELRNIIVSLDLLQSVFQPREAAGG